MPSGGQHEVKTRRAAVELSEQGHGAWAIAKQLKVPRNTVVRWVGHYRRQGDEGLEPAAMKQKYSMETKVAAVEALLGGTVQSQVMKDFEIRSDASLERWVRIYRKDGPEGLQPKPIGRPRKQPAPAAQETLEEKVHRLEMENAALRKLQALAARRRLRGQVRRPQDIDQGDFRRNPGPIWAPKVRIELVKRHGIRMSGKTVLREMTRSGCPCRIRRRKYQSYKGEAGKTAPNVLKRNFHAKKPNSKWGTDVTEFKVAGRKMYLSPSSTCSTAKLSPTRSTPVLRWPWSLTCSGTRSDGLVRRIALSCTRIRAGSTSIWPTAESWRRTD